MKNTIVAEKDDLKLMVRSDMSGTKFALLKGGIPVGLFTMNSRTSVHTSIKDGYHRQGLATWAYNEIERYLGLELLPNENLSEAGAAFWQKRRPTISPV